jgi:hypothetical protein
VAVVNQQRHGSAQTEIATPVEGRIESHRDTMPLARVEPVVQRDPEDAVARITGSHPRDVLVAFCRVGARKNPRAPMRVTPSSNGWIGVYEEGGRTFGLFIQRDDQDPGLFSTDGRQPVEITPNAPPR